MKYLHPIVNVFLALSLASCSGEKSQNEGAQETPLPEIVMQIQKQARLYSTEYRLHKIITQDDTRQLQGSVLNQKYSIDLPLGKRSKAMARAGSIPRTSFFLKQRLTFVHQWSSYDTYLGNNGWEVVTQRTTLRENTLSLAFIVGYQFVSRHGFVLAPYFGYNLPIWLNGPFHTLEQSGTTAAYIGNVTLGMKLGWAF